MDDPAALEMALEAFSAISARLEMARTRELLAGVCPYTAGVIYTKVARDRGTRRSIRSTSGSARWSELTDRRPRAS